jgi:hypothetical protein
MSQDHFVAGQPIVLRQLWQGKIWQARPAICVQDSSDLIACYLPQGILWKSGRGSNGEFLRPIERSRWGFADSTWPTMSLLRMSIPGEEYSVLIFRNADDTLSHWYINLEEPLKRASLGFDFEDNILDVILTSDLKDWRWEDEDELEEAVVAGLVSAEKATALYEGGTKAVALLQSGISIFNGWENWRQDPSWSTPILPEGWDAL